MTEINLADLLKATENPAQTESIMGMMNQAVEFMKKADTIISTLQKWGVSPEIVERLAIKFGKLEEIKPLPERQKQIIGVVPASDFHEKVFRALNDMTPEQLTDAAEKMSKDAGKTTA